MSEMSGLAQFVLIMCGVGVGGFIIYLISSAIVGDFGDCSSLDKFNKK